MKKPKIVILGAGFAGLMTVVTLQKELTSDEAEIILINKHEYHFQRTWLHQVAGGTLHPNRVRFDIESLLDLKKVKFIKDTVKSIKPDEKKVILDNDIISYDFLVVGLGSTIETGCARGINEYALTISSVNAARRIKNHIEEQFATYHSNKDQEGKLTIVVAGGGLTGIEFIGELTEWIPKLRRRYHVDKKQVKIICVSSSILTIFDEEMAEYAVSSLQKKGVQFKRGYRVKECTKDGVFIGKKGEEEVELVKANTILWAAGIKGISLVENTEIVTNKGRVQVRDDLRAPGYEDHFVIGDCSIFIDKKTGEPFQPTAQIALQQGVACAENVIALIRHETPKPFKPNIRGIVCSLGSDNAVGVVYGKKLFGSKALLMKKLIDNRALYMLGGSTLILKKGRFNLI